MKKAESNIKTAGQSVIEILVALTIFSLVAAAIFTLFSGGQSLVVDSTTAEQAIGYANEGVEAVKSIRDRNWSELVDGDHGLVFLSGEWYFASGTSDTRGIFTRKVNISAVDQWIKKASTTVSWQTNFMRPQTIELLEELVNWEELRNVGGDGGGGPTTGNWQNPQTLGSTDLGPGNSGTDLDVIQKIIYLSSEASASSKPDLYIIDATNGQNLSILSNLDVGAGLLTLDVAGSYVYAGSKDTSSQLQIINVANKNSPSLTASFQLPGVSGSGAVGNSIFFYGNKIYLGTQRAIGPELHIIDVSNPAAPSSLGSKEINADVNAIYIKDNLAYLATSAGLELQIFDISNPAQIALVGTFDAEGDADAKSLSIDGNKLYLGRKASDDDEFYIIDISNPASPQKLGSKSVSGDINDLRVRNQLAFLATSDSNAEFQTFNIANPAAITLWSSFNFPQVANGLDYEDNLVYVAVRSNDAVRIITSQ